MVIVQLKHARRLRMCTTGIAAWFEKHNLDLKTFTTVGLPAEELEKTGDAMALAVVRVARKEYEKGLSNGR